MATRRVQAGRVAIGGGAPVTVQSMLSLPWGDLGGNVQQAKELEKAGCEIIRVAVPTKESVGLVEAIKKEITVPLVADIHFDYKLALEAAAAGADKIRLNPGNIGGEDRVRAVAKACRAKGIPIRIGVNSGSVEKELLAKHGGPTPEAMVESALYHASLLEKFDFGDIVLSLKSSGVRETMQAYRLAAERCDYPLHLGVTEAGTSLVGMTKSAIGIGGLLLEGIGDTIRVSLTAPVREEVLAGRAILKALGMAKGPNIISCPSCGRTKIDLVGLTHQVEAALADCALPITVAVMGCVVNGPGEAREADIGVAGGNGNGLLFAKGEPVKKVPEPEIIPALLELVRQMEEQEKESEI